MKYSLKEMKMDGELGRKEMPYQNLPISNGEQGVFFTVAVGSKWQLIPFT